MAMAGGGLVHANGIHAEKETNIHVVVRVRPRSAREIRENSPIVITTSAARSRDLMLRAGGDISKTYGFDRVFGPDADQETVFSDVVAPILEEVLMGYNCTIFAYGQTGTGKTYTMEGNLDAIRGRDAGIIPRTLYSLFDTLERDQNEYSVRVSFIELYNEELKDLLSVDDVKLRIFEDLAKKGSVVIQGLEELLVKNAEDVIAILQRGSIKRQTASTKMNEVSSRSHCIFSITVHIKETTPDGEELLKVGKLNLVDLAGSENIGRSGAEKKRAQEAGMINQSLLTLGRVINALVDRSPHIPYRESKLTRLLQDSLGGRTKTCIIAAVSPARSNLEESMSTLDYAHRAKNIRNKPEVNQKMTKKALIREYVNEIERLKSDLLATREKNGIYLSAESYNNLVNENQSRKDSLEEIGRIIQAKETSVKQIEEKLHQEQRTLKDTSTKLNLTLVELESRTAALQRLNDKVHILENRLMEQVMLTEAHSESERSLHDMAVVLRDTVTTSVEDADGLHAKIARKNVLEKSNLTIFKEFQNSLRLDLIGLDSSIATFQDRSKSSMLRLSTNMKEFAKKHSQDTNLYRTKLDEYVDGIQSRTTQLVQNMGINKTEATQALSEIAVAMQSLRSSLDQQTQSHMSVFEEFRQVSMQELIQQKSEIAAWTTSARAMVGKAMSEATQELHERLRCRQIAESNLQTAMLNEIQSLRSQISGLEAALAAEREAADCAKSKLMQDISVLMDSFLSQRHDAIQNATNPLKAGLDAHAQRVNDVFVNQANDAAKETAKSEQYIRQLGLQSQEVVATFDSLDAWAENSSIKLRRQLDNEHLHFKSSTMATTMLVDSGTKGVQESVKQVCQSTESATEEHIAIINEETRDTSQMLDSVDSTMQASNRVIADSIDLWNTEICKAANFTADFAVASRADLQRVHGEIEGSQLREDIPTGNTPRKRSYNYPKSWTLTRSHDELLQEFRAKATMRPNTPSPSSSSTEDLMTMKLDQPETPSVLSKLPKLRKEAAQQHTPRRVEYV
ncbi:hypothetical protein SeMB42_g05867 [Synchytrium endobioticum]|uniref:Kinesin motor domain-containing protein n=1 Tax=Synchytrium endobioticum TaxID=286115 RepID=A0A507D7D1_9FUNG|nr:hypothetical protein SeMB42_g05867 [Synchytrium endobioticum]TPX47265.1 hypothetical protein SeLEV6574_g02761 [Synchytrium endobioticum]